VLDDVGRGLARVSPTLRRIWEAVVFAWPFVRPHRRRLLVGNALSFLAWGLGTLSTFVTAAGLSLLLGPRAASPPQLFGLRAGNLDSVAHSILATVEEWTRGQPQGRVVALLALIVLFLTVLTVAVNLGARVLWTRTKFDALQAMQTALFEHLCRLPVSFFVQERVGRLLAPFQREIVDTIKIIQTLMVSVVRAPVMFAVFLVLLYRTNVGLTLLTLGGGLGALLGSHALGKLRHRYLRSTYQSLGRLLASAQEAFLAVRVIKAFGAEAFVAERFRETAGQSARLEARGELMGEHVPEALGPLLNLGMLALLAAVGNGKVAAGELTREGLLLFLAVVVLLGTTAVTIGNALISLHELTASSERVRSLLALPVEPQPSGQPVTRFRDRIDLRAVAFGYDRGFGLGPVSLVLRRGERLAVVGASGAGKSTIVDLLLRLYEPAHGRIEMDGTDVRELDLPSYRRLFGVVAQDPLLLHGSIRANIACGRELTHEAVEEAARAAYAHEFIRQFPEGYETVAGERGLQLSGGQRQRIAIARALAGRPPILILDEATSSLDVDSEGEVLRALASLEREITLVVVSHRLSAVQGADRIVVLEEGLIAESGSHASLMAAGGAYRRLYEGQARPAEGRPPISARR
jgi:subfamily B ATP-binding cassette protein MsbA